MAIKDWVRDSMFPFDFTNKKTKHRLIIYEAKTETGYSWVVEIMSANEERIEQKIFKVKQTALAYAMDYMKKH